MIIRFADRRALDEFRPVFGAAMGMREGKHGTRAFFNHEGGCLCWIRNCEKDAAPGKLVADFHSAARALQAVVVLDADDAAESAWLEKVVTQGIDFGKTIDEAIAAAADANVTKGA
jgi:hypothetical protein